MGREQQRRGKPRIRLRAVRLLYYHALFLFMHLIYRAPALFVVSDNVTKPIVLYDGAWTQADISRWIGEHSIPLMSEVSLIYR